MRKYLLHICFPVLFALIISIVFAFQVSAYDKTDLMKVKVTGDCADCDLSAADLSDADLNGANLSRADLTHAYLSRADLTSADLSGAYLESANLSDAYLSGVIGLTVEQLSDVETLYEAKLEPELMEQVEDEYPHLLEKPEEE